MEAKHTDVAIVDDKQSISSSVNDSTSENLASIEMNSDFAKEKSSDRPSDIEHKDIASQQLMSDKKVATKTPGTTLTEEQIKKELAGLTSDRAAQLQDEVGFNELPHVEVWLLWIFFIQFTGLMPYMLEIACILALAVEDWIDFAIIAAIVLCNGYLGFTEELKAKASLDELTSKMEQKIAVIRDGKAEHLLTRLLVPGDVVLLLGGCSVPADVEWLEGDILAIDTAALTGEPLPRKYPSEDHGALILCGTTVRAGEAYCVVRKTGVNTEIGSSQAEIMQDKTVAKVSFFEERVLFAVKIIILVSLVDVIIIFLIQGIGRREFEGTEKIHTLVLTCLSIIIASVPVALPLVLQVTMALGAGKMARDFDAVVTSLPALQDIASMSILCSDKTGTLTTARITIREEAVWCGDGFTPNDVALYGALGSNRDKAEDAIDRSVINHFDKIFGSEGIEQTKVYVKTRSVGFNPIYKRVLWEYTHPVEGRITVVKGLPAKIIDTEDGGKDDAEDQWKVENHENIMPVASRVDLDFSKNGYKTLGVAVKINGGPFRFVGILPMLDPPRHDTKQTIKNLVAAGIHVKMITGDHLNIAKETARLIGLGTNIHAGKELRENGLQETKNEMVLNADGFAQVLPADKREVVLVLKNTYKVVVGMTGDGVNDAPALSAAQCGVAVDDATDAAKNAAAIILTSPGLSAIYSAVVESRRIFRKLKSYVTYRFAATIQIVIVLTLLIYISNCPINSLYIILLALFNDLTMLPIAYDNQQASVVPEQPNVNQMLKLSAMLGLLETCFSLLWAYGAGHTGIFDANFNIALSCSKEVQSGIWVQMSIAAEILIFSARAPKYMWTSIAPSPTLFASVMLGCLLFSIFACDIRFFGYLTPRDVTIIWCYDLACLIVIDICKVQYLIMNDEFVDVLVEGPPEATAASAGDNEAAAAAAAEDEDKKSVHSVSSRQSATLSRVEKWQTLKGAIGYNPEDVVIDPTRSASSSNINIKRKGSSAAIIAASRSASASNLGKGKDGYEAIVPQTPGSGGAISVPHSYAMQGSSTGLRGGAPRGASLRPHTPGNLGRR